MGYYVTHHQGAKLKLHELKFRRINAHDTHNSTSAGAPFPIVLSHADWAETSLTFVRVSGLECARASAPRPRVDKRKVTFMVSGGEGTVGVVTGRLLISLAFKHP